MPLPSPEQLFVAGGTLAVVVAILYVLVPKPALEPILWNVGRRTGAERPVGAAALAAFVLGPVVGYLLAPSGVTVSELGAAFVLAGYALGLFLLASAVGNRPLYRRVRAADPYASPVPGPFVTAGPTRPRTPDTAPFSGREAACWVAEAEVKESYYGRGFSERSYWSLLEAGSGGVPFTVDGVLVDPADARVLPFGPLPGIERGDPETFVDEYLPAGVRAGLARLRGVPGEDVENHAGEEGARFRDAVVAPGESVTVVGELERVPAGEYEDTYVIRSGEPFCVVAGGLEAVETELRKAVVRNGALALCLLAVSVVGGLFVLELL